MRDVGRLLTQALDVLGMARQQRRVRFRAWRAWEWRNLGLRRSQGLLQAGQGLRESLQQSVPVFGQRRVGHIGFLACPVCRIDMGETRPGGLYSKADGDATGKPT